MKILFFCFYFVFSMVDPCSNPGKRLLFKYLDDCEVLYWKYGTLCEEQQLLHRVLASIESEWIEPEDQAHEQIVNSLKERASQVSFSSSPKLLTVTNC